MMHCGNAILVGLAFVSGLFALSPASAAEKPLAVDEQLLWFPALATPHKEGWKISLSGLITEDENSPATSWLSRKLLGFSPEELGVAERAIFTERTQRFFADDERGKRIEVEILGQRHKLGKTGRNGQFAGDIVVSQALLIPGQRSVAVRAWVNKRVATNLVQLCVVDRIGLSVISDIDDTIKVSQVRDRHELMRNTFLRPFRAVDGMATVYQAWATNSGAQFHYVSGSPWQLAQVLDAFVITNHFPAGSWHLRSVRLLDTSALDLLKTPDAHKNKMIEELFQRLPDRRFVLVGDSGERDPEIYGNLARKHPKRVERIFIRNVTDEPISSARYVRAFDQLPKDLCVIFEESGQLPKDLRIKD